MKIININSYPDLINPVIDELKKIEIKEYNSRKEIENIIKNILLDYGYINGNEYIIYLHKKDGCMYDTHNYVNLKFEEHKNNNIKTICSISFYAKYNIENNKIIFLGLDEFIY